VEQRRHRDGPALADVVEAEVVGTTTSSNRTSLKPVSPVILMSGRTVTPFVFADRHDEVREAVVLVRVEVRQIMIIQLAKCARLVHTLWPFTIQLSPWRTAGACAFARSLPAPGSEKPWHQISSAEKSGGRKRRFCSAVP
jgi:hypothetical protein